MFERSRFSLKFINVKNVLRIRAFKSSVKCSPLVATRASRSPCSVMNRMISRCRSCGALPSAVSRRISAQLVSSASVKCSTHNFCSASAGGASFLHPADWQGVPMDFLALLDRVHPPRRKSSLPRGSDANPASSLLLRAGFPVLHLVAKMFKTVLTSRNARCIKIQYSVFLRKT